MRLLERFRLPETSGIGSSRPQIRSMATPLTEGDPAVPYLVTKYCDDCGARYRFQSDWP